MTKASILGIFTSLALALSVVSGAFIFHGSSQVGKQDPSAVKGPDPVAVNASAETPSSSPTPSASPEKTQSEKSAIAESTTTSAPSVSEGLSSSRERFGGWNDAPVAEVEVKNASPEQITPPSSEPAPMPVRVSAHVDEPLVEDTSRDMGPEQSKVALEQAGANVESEPVSEPRLKMESAEDSQSDSTEKAQSDPSVEPQSDPSVEPQSDPSVEPQSDASVGPQSGSNIAPQSDSADVPQSDSADAPQSEPTPEPEPTAATDDSPVPSGPDSEFRAGNIISDELFFTFNGMNADEIQTFLNNQNPSCYPGSDGTPCLKDYRADTENMTYGYCFPYEGAANESAAEIIAKAAKACEINPQVLIVMLEKEQSLVRATGDSLYPTRYTSALGMGCPDGAPCDDHYAGLARQVYAGAAQLLKYGEDGGFNFYAGTTANISYNVGNSCGSSPVYIENRATAALYNYTPYQPNAAALQNLYGTGDSCSTYGNRNFWRLFTDWFGGTH